MGNGNTTAQHEIDRLANYIMNEIPGEPSQDGSAVDTIIRVYEYTKAHSKDLERQAKKQH